MTGKEEKVENILKTQQVHLIIIFETKKKDQGISTRNSGDFVIILTDVDKNKKALYEIHLYTPKISRTRLITFRMKELWSLINDLKKS